jgi:LPS sulfotransferase NodH
LAPDGQDAVRFLIVGAGRTGSTMLVRALDSHPAVRCMGEVFNPGVDFIPYGVSGYDDFSAGDRALRARDGEAFLRERVFAPAPGVRAAGFKLLYSQHRAFPGLLERLSGDRALRVIHVRRRNLLRLACSARIAEATGVFVEAASARSGAERARLALRHPARAARALLRRLRPGRPPRPRLTLSPDECAGLFRFFELRELQFDFAFEGHERLTLFYEDLASDSQAAFASAQRLLGVELRPLAITSRRQNPEPLRELLANYDELEAAFRDTPYAAFFA